MKQRTWRVLDDGRGAALLERLEVKLLVSTV